MFHALRRARPLAARAALLIVALLVVPAHATAVHDSVLQGIAAGHVGRIFTLKVNMREPESGANNAPMLDKDGWHFWNPSGRIILSEGERIEVTGAFNYSTRGFFLELARENAGFGDAPPIQSRPRIRIRIMVEADQDKPDIQAVQCEALLGAILRPADSTLPKVPNQ